MSEGVLNQEELEAIQEAMASKSAARRPSSVPPQDASPIALIADDRDSERARPEALRLANQWAPLVATRARRALGVEMDATVGNVEVLDGEALQDELAQAWFIGLRVGGKDQLLFRVTGPFIEAMAVRLLGSKAEEDADEDAEDRAPSAVARGIFKRVGHLLTTSLVDAWGKGDGRSLAPLRTFDAKAFLADQDTLLAATLSLTKPAKGRLQVIARPETFIPPRPTAAPAAVPRRRIRQAIEAVPVEISVELGRAELTMRELVTLSPGTVIELDRTLDDSLVVRCEGIPKALGKPLSSQGNLAVQIVSALSPSEVD